MKLVGLQKTAATAWENVAIAYAYLFQKVGKVEEELVYSLPPIDTYHIRRMSRQWGIIQFSKGNRPDSSTGYTLDDTARALMSMCQACCYEAGKGERTVYQNLSEFYPLLSTVGWLFYELCRQRWGFYFTKSGSGTG